MVSVLQDVLGVRAAKAKPAPCRAHLPLRCGLVIDRDLNAARNLAGLVEAVANNRGTGSGPGTSRGDAPANGRGEERFVGSPRCSSLNRQDGTSPVGRDKTVTATRQRVAPEPVLIGSDR